MDASQLIDRLSKAIGRKEDFFSTKPVPTISQRLNNPGCLPHWKDPSGTPYPEVNGFVEFPECQNSGCSHPDHPAEQGWRALRAQCKINVLKRDLTFLQFFAGKPGLYKGFCPKDDNSGFSLRKNDPAAYAREVLVAVAGPGSPLTINSAISVMLD